MRFSELAKYLERLEATASRNEITRILAEAFSKTPAAEIDQACYLLLGELVPSYRGLEFQLAEKMMIQVLASAYVRTPEQISRAYKQKGDLGNVAYELAGRHREGSSEKGLSIGSVYEALTQIAHEQGQGSQERKRAGMASLLSGLNRLSAKYVVRMPLGKLRLGFSDATILDALSLLTRGDKSARQEIEKAYNVTADIGLIALRLKKGGLASLARIRAQPGIPIRPSLAERLQDTSEVVKKAGPVVGVEQKLDGFRTQIHVWREKGAKRVALFSRNLENTTLMFPEVREAAGRLGVRSVILDGETIGYNPATGKFAPFQETVQRKRKHGIEEFAKKIPLAVFVFDIMYLNGRPLVQLSFKERRRILERVFAGNTGRGALRLAGQKTTDDLKVIAAQLSQSVKSGLEGLVVKNLEAPYEAGRRGFHWIKLKATTAALEKLRAGKAAGLPDTIDCVLMGAWRGRGKRTRFGVGGFLLGVRGADDVYYSISRLGTGLSDADFREARRRIGKLEVREKPKEYAVDKETEPDIWIRPSLVVEILADEITLSPRHTAGRKREGGRGWSLRFPRLVRWRDDKKPEDATTIAEIAKMYRSQKSR